MGALKCFASEFKKLNIFRFLTVIFILSYVVSQQVADEFSLGDYLLCRSCGHEIADAKHFVHKPSPLSKHFRNETVLGVQGVLIQLFENPQGKQFELFTTSKADVFKQDEAFAHYSWFPDYLWRIVVCPRCGFHLGWSFEPADHQHGKEDSERTFIGLILENLLHPDFADSLIVIPKLYRS